MGRGVEWGGVARGGMGWSGSRAVEGNPANGPLDRAIAPPESDQLRDSKPPVGAHGSLRGQCKGIMQACSIEGVLHRILVDTSLCYVRISGC